MKNQLLILSLLACAACSATTEQTADPSVEDSVDLDRLDLSAKRHKTTVTPVIMSISPASAPAAGGTTLHLYGSSFTSGRGLAVTVGGSTCSNVTWVSASEVTCVAPAKTAGTYDVVENNPNGVTSGTSGAQKYTAVAAPTLGGVAPANGPVGGGTSISLTGTGFASNATVTVNGVACTNVTVASSTRIDAVTPPGPGAGAMTVVVTNPDGQNIALGGAFYYDADGTSPPPPTVTSLRGTNLVGMEGGYSFNQANGPIPDTEYPVHSTQVVDYLATKQINVIRFLFSWERMQSTLGGPIPAASSGNYKSYFDDYKRIVDYATNVKGMTVIIEPWQANSSGGVGGPSWRGNLVGAGVVTNAHFADFWSKMATVYKDNPRVSIGLINEPNSMSTMTWFSAAQAAVDGIRGTGFSGEILVPGNGWDSADGWTSTWYDTASTPRSNAYGWMNARGPGLPLSDALGKLVVEVHNYADANASGGTTVVASTTTSREHMVPVTDWARANGLKVFVGEIGMYALAANASADWSDFVSYVGANADTVDGFAWWACGKPGWWNDVAASGGGHFSITPTNNYTTDTVNMDMIEGSFLQ